ncbi:MAG: hypothetical protein AAGD25_02370 [Cyanobacteria bacterium P01_F01_bin.150]
MLFSLRYFLGGVLLTLIPLFGTVAFANTEEPLFAQRVVDGLPPPPPIPDLQIPDEAELPRGNGPLDVVQEDSGALYMVYVNGDSPLLLEQVQQVEPTASVQPYEGQKVILAGLFDSSRTANEQAERLGQKGIEASVVSVSSVVLSPSNDRPVSRNPEMSGQDRQALLSDLPPADPPSPINSASSRSRPSVSVETPNIGSSSGINEAPPATANTNVTNLPRRDNAYYVVIPGDTEELNSLLEQVVLLGAVQNAVEQRDRPLGPHLLVGPFVDQDAATRWNRYFQDFGMDARVYYKR